MANVSTAADVADEVVDMLISRGQEDYIGEAISQLEHSLQAAHLAAEDQASEEVILAALLHDIGHFLPGKDVRNIIGQVRLMSNAEGSVGRVGHEKIGEMWLLGKGFSPKLSALVGSHVAAKRYLCAVDSAYYDTLSDASKKSLKFQGGPFEGEELQQWAKDPICGDMCRLRKWDDQAKVVDLVVPTAEDYRSMMIRHLSTGQAI